VVGLSPGGAARDHLVGERRGGFGPLPALSDADLRQGRDALGQREQPLRGLRGRIIGELALRAEGVLEADPCRLGRRARERVRGFEGRDGERDGARRAEATGLWGERGAASREQGVEPRPGARQRWVRDLARASCRRGSR
jgi:hypothetical protein